MNKLPILLMTFLFLALAPLSVLAMSHGDGDHEHAMKQDGHDSHMEMDHSKGDMGRDGHDMKMEGQDHSMHGEMEHGSMGGMQMIGQCEREGVTAMAHIKAYGAEAVASMSKMGMAGTHHLMVYFQKVGEQGMLADGMAAVKIKGPDGETSAPVKLMAMGAGYGADVALPAKGEYQLEVGTKLKDGKKRQFEFSYEIN